MLETRAPRRIVGDQPLRELNLVHAGRIAEPPAPSRRARSSAVALIGIALLAVGPAAAHARGAPLAAAPGCPIFPDGNVWNQPVDNLPAARGSARLIRGIGAGAPVHPDFSDRGRYGIPINVATSRTPRHRVRFRYATESDRVPYPIPRRPRIERGSDRHLIVLDRDRCRLYELFDARRIGGRWRAGSGAVWDLGSNTLRRRGFTSADAAGLPILPGLVRHRDVAHGEIDHALRFTAPRTRRAFVYPARHFASDSTSASLPPMGLRVRLRHSVSLRGHGPQARTVIRALKRYGMILADNGSPWFITGAPSAGWDDDDLRTLRRLRGRDFEVVDTRRLRNGPRASAG